MSDINVTAHGINPETGEYLSPAERKALFKKGKMGSKVDPSVFKSGVVSGVKAAQNVRQKAEADVGDFVQQERDLDELNAAAGGGGKGAIVPFTEVFSDKKPPAENVRVNVDDAPPQEAEESKESFKDALKKLLETLKRITNLKNKQKKSSKKTDKLKSKKKKEKKKERKTPGRDIFGVGRKIKGKITNVFGDIFGIFGDIIAFAALNWISDPKNRKAVKGIVTFMGHAFKFINSFVEGFIDNTLTGLSQLLGPDRSIGERFSGALKLIASFFILRWLKNPFKLVKDLRKTFKIFKTFGKFVNKILRKPIRMIQNFVQKSLNKTLGKVFMSKLFKPLRRFIIKVGGKSLFKLLGAVGRGFTKMISRIPFIGALLQFFLDVFVFKQPPARSAFKAIGTALIGVVGAAIGGPIGAAIGGWVGGNLGEKLYDGWFGGGSTDTDKDKKDSSESKASTSGGQSGGSGQATGEIAPSNIYQEIGANAEQWNIFRNTVAQIESGGSYAAMGGSGDHYDGRYQMGEAAKIDGSRIAGVQYPGHSNDPNAHVRVSYRSNPELQETIFTGFTVANHKYLMGNSTYASSSVERKLQILGYAHNQGMGGAEKWITTGVVGADGFGTKGTKYTDSIAEEFRKRGGQGGGSGMVRPNKPAAKMKRNSVKNMYMPSMSTEFVINEKIKTNNIVEQPIIINNIKEENLGVHTSGFTLNKGRKPVNQVLSRL